MSTAEIILACLALGVGLVLAWRCVPWVRGLLFVSTLMVSGLLFLPGKQLVKIAGRDTVAYLGGLTTATPWALSEWAHLFAFLWLAFLLWVGRHDFRGKRGICILVVLATAAEAAQGLTPGREPRILDVGINLLGAMAGVLLGIVLRAVVARSKGGHEKT